MTILIMYIYQNKTVKNKSLWIPQNKIASTQEAITSKGTLNSWIIGIETTLWSIAVWEISFCQYCTMWKINFDSEISHKSDTSWSLWVSDNFISSDNHSISVKQYNPSAMNRKQMGNYTAIILSYFTGSKDNWYHTSVNHYYMFKDLTED